MFTQEEGRAAVALAREALTEYVVSGKRTQPRDMPPSFDEDRGVFVTLHENGELRGCIGYPEPVMALGKAIVDCAVAAGTRDPRFPRVEKEELDEIVMEVTVLTKPETFDLEKRMLPDAVEVGKHGLIVTRGGFSGLLLPQVATEWGFDSMDFLCQTCIKAGLSADAWVDEETEVQHFEARIFSETVPRGTVVEKELQGCATE